jgi:acyl carrier protein
MPMTEQEIHAAFAETLEEFVGVPADEVTGEADLAEDLDIDSLTMIEIVVEVRDKFGVEVPDVDLRQLRTVQDVVSYVQRMQSSSVPA